MYVPHYVCMICRFPGKPKAAWYYTDITYCIDAKEDIQGAYCCTVHRTRVDTSPLWSKAVVILSQKEQRTTTTGSHRVNYAAFHPTRHKHDAPDSPVCLTAVSLSVFFFFFFLLYFPRLLLQRAPYHSYYSSIHLRNRRTVFEVTTLSGRRHQSRVLSWCRRRNNTSSCGLRARARRHGVEPRIKSHRLDKDHSLHTRGAFVRARYLTCTSKSCYYYTAILYFLGCR